MIITKEMRKEKVPKEFFPKRLDSAMNLYCTIKKDKEYQLILYNNNPAWNVLYPFYEMNHKFTMNDYQFSKDDMTYEELIEEFQMQFSKIHELENGNTKEIRKKILLEEFQKEFDVKDASIGAECEPIYEIKYSKTQNVYTLYYFENYILGSVNDVKKLTKQTKYPQEQIAITNTEETRNGIPLGSNVPYFLSQKENQKILEQNALAEEK